MCDNDWIYNCVELHFRMAAHIFFKKCVCWLIFIKTEYINHGIFCLPDLWVCIPKPKIIPTLGGIITLQFRIYCTPHENILLLFLDQCLFFHKKNESNSRSIVGNLQTCLDVSIFYFLVLLSKHLIKIKHQMSFYYLELRKCIKHAQRDFNPSIMKFVPRHYFYQKRI